MNLIEPRTIRLRAGVEFSSPKIIIPGTTTEVELRLRRPTTASPLAWERSAKLRTRIVIMLDGKDVGVSGGASGGVRTSPQGVDIPFYKLIVKPTAKIDSQRRIVRYLGEDATTEYAAYVVLEAVGGDVETEILLEAR